MQAKSIGFLDGLIMADMNAGKPPRSNRTDFAKRLAALREAAGLSQRDVARQLGISQPSYVNWERRNVSLKPEQLLHLAEILGVPPAVLLEGQPTAPKRNGPRGKMRRLFEEASQLPRSRQQRILAVLEDMIAAQQLATKEGND